MTTTCDDVPADRSRNATPRRPGGRTMGPDRKRIQTELRKLWADPPDFCRPGASPVTDILHWEVVIDGPDGSPYAGGTFPVDIDFIGNYPVKPPKITFKTKVYHPNISSEGELMLDIFHSENWTLAMAVDKLLLYIVSVLYDPVLDCDPINEDVADVYESDIELYEGMAMAWTWEYSSTPIVSHHYPVRKDSSCHNDLQAASVSLFRCSAAFKEKRSVPEASAAARKTNLCCLPMKGGSWCSLSKTWTRVVAFLQGCTVALPFPTFRRRFSSTLLLPLINYSGCASF